MEQNKEICEDSFPPRIAHHYSLGIQEMVSVITEWSILIVIYSYFLTNTWDFVDMALAMVL